MRLWSIHPKYLDSQGLVAVWREGLLARKVLSGQTSGYRNHPQLTRFKRQQKPLKHIDAYLYHVWKEAKRRGYNFNRMKIGQRPSTERIPITTGQLTFELQHLRRKLHARDPERLKALEGIGIPNPHPIFVEKAGPTEKWEKIR